MRISALLLALACAAAGSAQPDSPLKGSVSGRVLDPNGRPFPNVRVSLWRWTYRSGRKQLNPVTREGPITEDDGRFFVGDLDPGNYILRAENPYLQVLDLPVVGNLPPQPQMVTTYYPGVLDPLSASNIEVSVGQGRNGLEFRVQKPNTFHIRGQVSGAGGGLTSVKRQDGLVPWDDAVSFQSRVERSTSAVSFREHTFSKAATCNPSLAPSSW